MIFQMAPSKTTKPNKTDPGTPAGDVKQVKQTNRIAIPADVLHATGWRDSSNPDIEVVAELVSPGRVRLHQLDGVEEHLSAERQRLERGAAGGEREALEELAAFADRFRSVPFYSDGRVRLPEAILVFLGITPGERPYVYVRPFGQTIEILSQAARNECLAQHSTDEPL